MYDLILDRANDSGQEYLLINICNGAPYTKANQCRHRNNKIVNRKKPHFKKLYFKKKKNLILAPVVASKVVQISCIK